VEILENKAEWSKNYREGWLAHLQKTGAIDWKMYHHPKNRSTPGVPGIELSQSRLMLISSAGGYLFRSQPPFEEANPIGDYTIRFFPSSTPFDALAYAHGHFDHTVIEQDTQVALPLRHLEAMVAASEIGALAPSVVSFMGYQPDSARVIDELIPEILAIAQAEKMQAALLAPV
jgi:hypothetical protein